MEKYSVYFNDGEFIDSFDTLDEAMECKNDIFHHYISRWAVIYDKNGNKV